MNWKFDVDDAPERVQLWVYSDDGAFVARRIGKDWSVKGAECFDGWITPLAWAYIEAPKMPSSVRGTKKSRPSMPSNFCAPAVRPSMTPFVCAEWPECKCESECRGGVVQ